MLNYSIMPLDGDHIEEYLPDIERQVREGVATMPLFKVTLTPEGDPAIDKAELCMQVYEKYKSALDARSVPSGILLQATIGHGWKLNQPSAFQKIVGLRDGLSPEVCCPLDRGFLRYIRASAARIAETRPHHIMLDDDFRLMGERPGFGCACPLHMKELSRLAGYEVTRESLLRALDKGETPLRALFVKTQIDSLVACAREIRAGIDSVDPTIPGSFCLCGPAAEGALEIATIMAGKGNPIALRLNNANYCAENPRVFVAKSLLRAAVQKAALGGKVDALLAETDTCPQNRYSTSAAMMHSHFTFTILEGAKGAKHWITRLSTFEPNSGDAYRKKLAKYRGFHEELCKISDEVDWLGCRIPVPSHPIYALGKDDARADKSRGWIGHLLDRFGLPTYFSSAVSGVTFLDGDADRCFTDDEIREILSGKVILDAEAAERLSARGFSAYLGVDVKKRETGAKNASGEIFSDGKSCGAMYDMHEIVLLAHDVKVYSTVYHLRDGKHRDPLFPGVTGYTNSLGGRVVVFAGVTNFPYNISHAFGFLCETRKELLVSILGEMDALPLYYPGDAEAFLKVGRLPDGSLVAAFLDMSLDPIEDLPLAGLGRITSVERLTPDGGYEKVGFACDGGLCRLDLTAYPYDPLILRLTPADD